MRFIEFADPEIYSLAVRDAGGLFKQIERIWPDGSPDDVKPGVLCVTKQASTKRRKLLDAL
jgi:hypothetical protein